MNHLLLLSFLYLLHTVPGYSQTAYPPKKWTMQHRITKEKRTFKAKHWMQITWRENDTTRTMKAKLYRLDADSVTIVNKDSKVDIARKDVTKVSVIKSFRSWVYTSIGMLLLGLGIFLGLMGFLANNITSSLGGTSSNIRDFKNMFLIGLAGIGLGIGFLRAGKFDDTTKKEPFSAQWMLKPNTVPEKQNKPEQSKKNAQPGNQLP